MSLKGFKRMTRLLKGTEGEIGPEGETGPKKESSKVLSPITKSKRSSNSADEGDTKCKGTFGILGCVLDGGAIGRPIWFLIGPGVVAITGGLLVTTVEGGFTLEGGEAVGFETPGEAVGFETPGEAVGLETPGEIVGFDTPGREGDAPPIVLGLIIGAF